MIYHHLREVSQLTINRFLNAQLIYERVRDNNFFGETHLSCHVLARVIAPFINRRAQSGVVFTYRLGNSEGDGVVVCDHSWVYMERDWILDIKPIGMMTMGPILASLKPEEPGFVAYHHTKSGDPYYPKAARLKKTREAVQNIGRPLLKNLEASPITGEQRKELLERFM